MSTSKKLCQSVTVIKNGKTCRNLNTKIKNLYHSVVKKVSGSQDQKERKTASNVTTFFSNKKSPQRKFASATIAFLVDLTNETIVNTSR